MSHIPNHLSKELSLDTPKTGATVWASLEELLVSSKALLPLIHSDPQGLMTAKAIRTSESDRVRRAERRPAERRQERLGGRVALTFAATMEFPQARSAVEAAPGGRGTLTVGTRAAVRMCGEPC